MSYMDGSDPPPTPAFRFSATTYALQPFDPGRPEADLGERPAYFHDQVEAHAHCADTGDERADKVAASLYCTALHILDWTDDEADYSWPDPGRYAGRRDMYCRVGAVYRELMTGLRLRSAVARVLPHPDGPRSGEVERLHLVHAVDEVDEGFTGLGLDRLLMAYFLRTFRRGCQWDLFALDVAGRRRRGRWLDFGFVELPGTRVLGWPIEKCPPSWRLVARKLAAAQGIAAVA